MKCAVIILNWNGEKMLRQFLPSVVQYTRDEGQRIKDEERKTKDDEQKTQNGSIDVQYIESNCPEVQVIVADNGSTDGSLQVLREDFPTVQVLDLGYNYGFAEGYNRAIQQVDAEYVVLLNSDVEVTEHWLTPILTYMDAHPEIVAAQPKILRWTKDKGQKTKDSVESTSTNTDPNSLPCTCFFEHAGAAGGFMDMLGYPYCRGRIMDYVEEDKGQYDTIMDIFWASGACLFIRRDAYIGNGGLDADFFAHMEEIDLCWRLNARGYKLVCIPESTVYHLGGGSLPYNNPRKTFLNFRNNLLMIYKNAPAKSICRVLFIRFAMDYAAAMMYILKGEGQQFMAVVKARWAYHRLKKQFRPKRKENMQKTTVPHPETIIRRSIIWDFYVRGLRK